VPRESYYRQASKGLGTSGSLVGDHSSDLRTGNISKCIQPSPEHNTYSSPQDSGGRAEMERSSRRVGIHSLLDKLGILDLVPSHYNRPIQMIINNT
jgi:hypothetical protein